MIELNADGDITSTRPAPASTAAVATSRGRGFISDLRSMFQIVSTPSAPQVLANGDRRGRKLFPPLTGSPSPRASRLGLAAATQEKDA
jgi:hypothetical protein